MSAEKRQDDIRLLASTNAKNIARARRLEKFDGTEAGYSAEQATALNASAERITALTKMINAELTVARGILQSPEGIQARGPVTRCDC